jgi:nicotinate-nucleotide adenylyltransferase
VIISGGFSPTLATSLRSALQRPNLSPHQALELRIGILGGSFDPIHNGHLIVATLASEQLQLDEVRFVVAGNQPLKVGHGAPAEERLLMVEVALRNEPHLVADGREIVRGGKSYTVDTLKSLVTEFPGADLTLLLGADAASRLDQWHDLDGIRRLARIGVFRRGQQPAPTGFDASVDVPEIELSSTAIRHRAAMGLSLSGWVPPAVADYISGLRLYQTQGGV